MRRNCHKTTSGVKFDLQFDFPVPDFLYGKKLWKLDHDFMHFYPIFCCACVEAARILLPVKFFNPKFETPMGCFLFEYESWWGFRQDLYVF